MKDNKWLNGILIIFLTYVIGLSAWLTHMDRGNDYSYYRNYKIEEWTNGWEYQDASGTTQISCGQQITVNAGEVFRVKRILSTDLQNGQSICFRTDHTKVRVLVSGELRYEFGYSREPIFGQTPGSIWHIIDLDRQDAGKEMTIELMCPYAKYSGLMPNVEYGGRREVLLYIFKDSFYLFVLSALPLLLAVFILMMSGQITQMFNMDWAVYVAIFLMVDGVWGITESRFGQFLFGRAFGFQMVNFIFFAAMPMCNIVAYHSLHIVEKGFKMVAVLCLLQFFGVLFAQLLEICDFFNSLIVVHAMVVICLGVGIYNCICRLRQRSAVREVIWYIIALAEQTVFGFMDIISFYGKSKYGNGFFYRIGSIIFIIIIMLSSMTNAYEGKKKQIQKETLEQMAYMDYMTRLGNRRAFEKACDELEQKKQSITILFIDLNGLKQINDNYGHEYGDRAIKHVARLIQEHSNQEMQGYRLGGDEFCALIQHKTKEGIEEMCTQINEELKEISKKEPRLLSIAYGYAEHDPKGHKTLEDTLKKADAQMYEKKARMKKMM